MPDLHTLLLFCAAALALILIPGPAVLYIVARSLHQGRQAGIVSALGVLTGGLLHVGAAAVGISALVLSSALLFSAVKLLGAAYLIYLGIRTLLSSPQSVQETLPEPRRLSQIYWQGALVNALNPKTALFFFAFLPQFVHPGHGPVALQTLIFGFTFLLLACISDSTYALLAGSLSRRLQGNTQFARRQKYVTGGVYMLLGVGTLAARHSAD
ncbi:LysE family translocator [Deinococcus sp. KNUC1210]|uniref:LysE family translocator n=1 Tax=Deinococcus sp. KNUC1210 TaxID=2917691 RepID=UPI001EEFA198|nr:LysE family translocator [Deinococcus sp. KNUC1210]ULH15388.1 LysE family translocator [Deinococcus sp. KNUC1210]